MYESVKGNGKTQYIKPKTKNKCLKGGQKMKNLTGIKNPYMSISVLHNGAIEVYDEISENRTAYYFTNIREAEKRHREENNIVGIHFSKSIDKKSRRNFWDFY
jgi:hypothetical protein